MGPIAEVDTIVAGINLDVARELYMGPGKTMEFIVPDSTETSGWASLHTATQGWHRITGQEHTTGEGSEVIFQIADLDDVLRPFFSRANLCVRVEDLIYLVSAVPPVASSEARVFTLTCKIRTLRTNFDNAK